MKKSTGFFRCHDHRFCLMIRGTGYVYSDQHYVRAQMLLGACYDGGEITAKELGEMLDEMTKNVIVDQLKVPE